MQFTRLSYEVQSTILIPVMLPLGIGASKDIDIFLESIKRTCLGYQRCISDIFRQRIIYKNIQVLRGKSSGENSQLKVVSTEDKLEDDFLRAFSKVGIKKRGGRSRKHQKFGFFDFKARSLKKRYQSCSQASKPKHKISTRQTVTVNNSKEGIGEDAIL